MDLNSSANSDSLSEISGANLSSSNQSATLLPVSSSSVLTLVPPSAAAALAKPSPSVWFTGEIQQMMHGFGDCRKPLLESAHLIEKIVHEQLITALYKAEDTARQRNARFIGIEDFLFLLRKDKVKLRRLIKYMELKDVKKSIMSGRTSVDEENVEGSADSESGRPQPKKRRKICYDFLCAIDQSRELVSIFEDDNYFDEIKHERALRAELMSRGMDAQQYLDFCAARQSSFVARYKTQKFKDWLLQGVVLDIKPNPLAVETMSYLAYETVAQVMDLSLMVKRDSQCIDSLTKVIPHAMMNYDAFQHNQMLPPQSTTTPLGNIAPNFAAVSAVLKSPGSSMPNSPLNSPPSTPTTPGVVGNPSNSLNLSGGGAGGGKSIKSSKKSKKQGLSGSKELYTSQAITVAHIREAMRRYSQNLGPFAEFSKCPTVSSKQRLLCA